MASVTSDPNGRRRIQFVGGDGRRKAIRLGKATARQAEAFKVRVEQLAAAAAMKHSPDDDTSRWLMGLDDRTYGRLAAVGLARPRQGGQLAEWVDAYLASRATELRPTTRTNLKVTRDHLVAFFGASRAMRTITRDEASAWRAGLLDGRAVATVRLYVGNARQLFGEAARRDVVPANVFDHLQAGTTAADNERYVTPAEAAAVLAACDDPGIRLTAALARLAGLRVPSETRPLTWGEVDFKARRMTVRSPKTARYAGKGRRVVPITPTLLSVLQAARPAICDPAAPVVPGPHGNERMRNLLADAIARAKVAPWPAPFRTLRSSCEREWAMTHPQFAVSKWVGHSITVSGKHYANHVPDELYDRAAGIGEAAQNAAQQPSTAAGNGTQTEAGPIAAMTTGPAVFPHIPTDAALCDLAVRTANFGPSSRPA